jgi:metal-sulfur cluster biosynthetic enzyme
VYDPEFGVSIDDLGLIYDVAIVDGSVTIAMTLTTPTCPAGEVIVGAVHAAVAAVQGVRRVEVHLVWDPQWSPDMINARGRQQLGWRDT